MRIARKGHGKESLGKFTALCGTAFEAKRNDWLIENRFAPAAKVYEKTADGSLREIDPPVTNVMLIAKKPRYSFNN